MKNLIAIRTKQDISGKLCRLFVLIVTGVFAAVITHSKVDAAPDCYSNYPCSLIQAHPCPECDRPCGAETFIEDTSPDIIDDGNDWQSYSIMTQDPCYWARLFI